MDTAQLPEIGKKLDCCLARDLWTAPRNSIAMGGQCQGPGSCTTDHHTIWVERFFGIWDLVKCNVIEVYPYANFELKRRRPRLVPKVTYEKATYN